MKKLLKFLAPLLLLLAIPTVHAAPKVPMIPTITATEGKTNINFNPTTAPEVPEGMKIEATADPVLDAPLTCPGNHCISTSFPPSADASANPSLAYNYYRWPTSGSAPVCTGPVCTGVAPINSAPILAGCANPTACTFLDSTVGPGSWNVAVTSFLNGSESVLSNILTLVIKPAAPVLSGSGQEELLEF